MNNLISIELMIKILLSGMENLYKNKDYVDSLNVFPVPDGDTGTNMYFTLKNSLNNGEFEKYNTNTLKIIANNTVLSSRGNSGTILSMFIKGFLEYFKNNNISSDEFIDAFTIGCRNARNCLDNPVEGTIITVMENTAECMIKYKNILPAEKVFEKGLECARDTLAKTPDMLPILKKAGVVDSGGQGFIYILEAMYDEYLLNSEYTSYQTKENTINLTSIIPNMNTFPKINKIISKRLNSITAKINLSNLINLSNGFKFPDLSSVWKRKIKYIYDVEFIVKNNNRELLNSILKQYGDSIIIVDTNIASKVHIHTNNPDELLNEINKCISKVENLFIENMQTQRDNVVNSMDKDFDIIVLIKNYGFEPFIREFNINKIYFVDNPTLKDINKLIKENKLKDILFLIADKNLEMVTKQAINNSKIHGEIISFRNEVYLLNSLFNVDSMKSIDTIKRGVKLSDNNKIITINISTKTCKFGDKNIDKNDFISMDKNNVLVNNSDLQECIMKTINAIRCNYSLITAYINEKYIDEHIIEIIKNTFPDIEIDIYNVGKANFIAILSFE